MPIEQIVAKDRVPNYDRRTKSAPIIESLRQALGARLFRHRKSVTPQRELRRQAGPRSGGRSCGVEMMRISRMPVSISVDNG